MTDRCLPLGPTPAAHARAHRRLRRRSLLVVGIWCIAATVPPSTLAQQAPTPAQSISAGARVYGAKGCGGCHAINGIGAAVGPDLARTSSASLNDLVAAMWGHLPQMAQTFAASRTQPPHLDPWEAADLMAFLFWTAASQPAGEAGRGGELFTDKGCAVCHQVGMVGGVLGPRLDDSESRFSSIELAAAMWNHGPSMGDEMESRGLSRPTLSGTDLDDLVAYFGTASTVAEPGTMHALSGDPDHGAALFRERSCIRCHRVAGEGTAVGPDLTRAARREPAAFAAAMWNKGSRMAAAMRASGVAIPRLSGGDMADLVAYLGTLQYASGAGRASRGAAAAAAGGCTGCHAIQGAGSGPGGDLARMDAIDTRASVIAAIWNHVALPADTLQRRWRPLSAAQVADLVAFFERRG